MRISVVAVAVCFSAVTLAALMACSSPSIPDDLTNDQNSTAGTKPIKKDSGTPTPAPTPTPTGTTKPPPPPPADGGPAPAPGTCGASATQDTCFTCCETANPKALPFLDQAWGDCVCVAPGACSADCALSFCAGVDPTAGDACDTCLTANDQACIQQADTACDASAVCKPLFACDDAAKCATKPK